MVTDKPAESDRDTEESSDDEEDLKKAERIVQIAHEQLEKEKKRVAKKARRIKTTANTGIFNDEDLEAQLVNLKREAVKKAGGRKVRRIKKSVKSTPSSQGAAFENL